MVDSDTSSGTRLSRRRGFGWRMESQGIFVVLATLLVFGRILGHGFVAWDDNFGLYDNPWFDPPGWWTLRQFWTRTVWNVYMPVTWSVWSLTAMLAYVPSTPEGAPPLNPQWFHGLSLATHACAAWLVYRILRQLRFERWPACMGATLFALHPLQVEPVAWVSGYNVVLCGALSLLAILQYLKFAEEPARGRRRRCYALATAAFALALLAKPMAATVPVVVLIIDLFLLRRPWRRSIAALAPWFVLAAALALTTTALHRSMRDQLPLWTRPFVAADSVAFYMRKLIWPSRLTIDYGRTPVRALTDPALPLNVLLPLVVATMLWMWRDRFPAVGAGAAGAVAWMLPVLGLVPFDFQEYSTVADRYAYGGVFGISIMVAALASRVPHSRRLALAAALMLVLAAPTLAQLRHWPHSHALFARASQVNRKSWLAWNNWGYVFIAQGRPGAAIGPLRQALALRPGNHESMLNLAAACRDAGNYPAALHRYRRLLAVHPESIQALLAYAAALTEVGMLEQAADQYKRVLLHEPDHLFATRRLSLLQATSSATAPTEPDSP